MEVPLSPPEAEVHGDAIQRHLRGIFGMRRIEVAATLRPGEETCNPRDRLTSASKLR
jgi:hypothetical protein